MIYNEYGFVEINKGKEDVFYHSYYPDVKFFHSSFMKEWVDVYIGADVKTIFDIGAFDGGDSLRFTSWYPYASVFSFEAALNNYNVIKYKLKDEHKNIKLFNKAISSENGNILLHQLDFPFGLSDDELVMGSIYPTFDSKLKEGIQKNIDPIMVESVTFDSFCKANGLKQVDIMHIDVEGATYNVCKGMNKVLPKMIFTEREHNETFDKKEGGDEELIGLLSGKGYELVKKLSNDFLFVLK